MKYKIVLLVVFGILLCGMSEAMAANEIIFDVNKSTYKPGDIVVINGTAKDSPSQLVAVQIKDPSGNTIVIRTVQTDNNGNFQLKFKLPSTAKVGNYNIVTNAEVNGTTVTQTKQIVQNTTPGTPTQTVTQTAAQKTSAPFGGKCLIATAAFGSETAPQVQFLRGIRDNHIQTTLAGSSFMTAFNDIYYSFSPYVADSERQNPYLRDTIQAGLYPLLGILQVSQISEVVKSEFSVIGAGVLVSTLIGATYMWPVGLAIKSVRKGIVPNLKITLGIVAVSVVAVISSLAFSNTSGLMISTSILVLSFTAVSALFTSWSIVKLVQSIKNRWK
ncbi:conserved membrane protein of unknown function [Nitrosotalea devaniterrae]|uniref:Macroglobulin domain-containing protein n=1 Tax=Nitrosotalea devaniterrae TaxID=1078905 RepID=A0A128A5R2_9ARCH|nr:conserved membrane protein of unknown function [Candidatus Nitrosotalea devanaterra]